MQCLELPRLVIVPVFESTFRYITWNIQMEATLIIVLSSFCTVVYQSISSMTEEAWELWEYRDMLSDRVTLWKFYDSHALYVISGDEFPEF